jgi:hypothetical protein
LGVSCLQQEDFGYAYIYLSPTSDLVASFTHTLSSITTSFEALDLLTYPIKLDALQGFGEEDQDINVDRRNFTSPMFCSGTWFVVLLGKPRPLWLFLVSHLDVYGLVELIGSLNLVVEIASTLSVKVLVAPSSHLLSGLGLAFVASSSENRVRPLWH